MNQSKSDVNGNISNPKRRKTMPRSFIAWAVETCWVERVFILLCLLSIIYIATG